MIHRPTTKSTRLDFTTFLSRRVGSVQVISNLLTKAWVGLLVVVLLTTQQAFALSNGDLQSIQNYTPFYDPTDTGQACSGGTTSSGTPGDLKTRQQKVWDGLRAAGFTPIQVAGIMGNMQNENGSFDPTVVEGGTHADVPPAYSAAAGADANNPGYGIVQWTPGVKLIPSAIPLALVHDLGWQINTLANQLTKAGSKPGDETAAGTAVKAATTVAGATQAFELLYERHSGPPQPQRVTNANKFLAEFGSSTPTQAVAPAAATTATPLADPCATPAVATGNSALGAFAWPITTKATITQCFVVGGHIGLDIAYTRGTPIFAAAAGTVVLAGGNDPGGYGLNYVAIQHGPQLYTSYGHMDSMLVKTGDVVKQGQQIGTEGNQGKSSGPHLHFNVVKSATAAALYYNGNVDPLTNGLALPPGVPNPSNCT